MSLYLYGIFNFILVNKVTKFYISKCFDWSVADFWSWSAHGVQLNYPYYLSSNIYEYELEDCDGQGM